MVHDLYKYMWSDVIIFLKWKTKWYFVEVRVLSHQDIKRKVSTKTISQVKSQDTIKKQNNTEFFLKKEEENYY